MLRAGLEAPARGSIRDQLFQELERRSQNLRLAEVWLVVQLLSEINQSLLMLLGAKSDVLQTYMESIKRRMMDYEAELYQDRYVPAFEAKRREEERKKKAEYERKRKEIEQF
jgi:hypothetical protein